MSDTDTRAGMWLLEQRLARGWTKAEMARRMHPAVSVSDSKVPRVSSIVRGLGGWERGEHYPRDSWRAVLCQVLGVKPADFPAAPGPAAMPATVGDLDADDPRPWVQVALMLAARIDAEKLNPGDPMPRPGEVAGQACVSVPTARKAYRYLRAMEVVCYRPGAGYYVSGQPHDSADAAAMTENEGDPDA
jgi:DNA-binding transcriptional regulator YhcF (GntR family)